MSSHFDSRLMRLSSDPDKFFNPEPPFETTPVFDFEEAERVNDLFWSGVTLASRSSDPLSDKVRVSTNYNSKGLQDEDDVNEELNLLAQSTFEKKDPNYSESPVSRSVYSSDSDEDVDVESLDETSSGLTTFHKFNLSTVKNKGNITANSSNSSKTKIDHAVVEYDPLDDMDPPQDSSSDDDYQPPERTRKIHLGKKNSSKTIAQSASSTKSKHIAEVRTSVGVIEKNNCAEKRKWTDEQDTLLLQLVNQVGPKFSKISDLMNRAFTGKQIASHYRDVLEPRILRGEPTNSRKNTRWSKEEKDLLFRLKDQGADMPSIYAAFPTRTPLQIRGTLHTVNRNSVQSPNSDEVLNLDEGDLN